MTQTECKFTAQERIDSNIRFHDQEIGEKEQDIDGKYAKGYEEKSVENISVSAKRWVSTRAYKRGSIVNYNGERYISKKNFNKNNSVFDSFYWVHQPINSADTSKGFVLSGFCLVDNNVVVASENMSFSSSGTVNYDYKFLFDTAASNTKTIPLIEPMNLKNTGAATNGILEFGLYANTDYIGQKFLTAGTIVEAEMNLFSAFVEI